MSSKRVTLREIADATGFSPNTVSRALRNQPVISEKTRKLIQDEALKIGYVPNRAARVLRSGTSGLVAFIVENLINPFFGAIFDYLDRASEALGYTVIVFSSHGAKDGEIAAINNAYAQNVDGILLISCDESGESLELMDRLSIPHVLLFRDMPQKQGSFVLQDEFHGGEIAAEHLMSLGCGRFAFAEPPYSSYSVNQRKLGFLEKLNAANVGMENILTLPASENDGMETSAKEILAFSRSSDKPVGICVYCDSSNYGLKSQLRKMLPEENGFFNFVSFDNIDDLIMSGSPVTSIGADFNEMCRFAIETLDREIRGEEADYNRKTFPVSLKIRM